MIYKPIFSINYFFLNPEVKGTVENCSRKLRRPLLPAVTKGLIEKKTLYNCKPIE